MRIEQLENNMKQMSNFKNELNDMSNWIENLNLDLIKQQQLSSNKTSTTSSKSSTPSPSSSFNNLFDKNVIIFCKNNYNLFCGLVFLTNILYFGLLDLPYN